MLTYILKNMLPLVLIVFTVILANRSPGDGEVKQRAFEFVYTVKVTNIPLNTHKVDMWLPQPRVFPYQQIDDISVTSAYPVQVKYDRDYGNTILWITTTTVKVSELVVEIKYKILRKEHQNYPQRISKNKYKNYLRSNKLMAINKTIQNLARKITASKKTDLEKARALYDFVLNYMDYDKTSPGWGIGDSQRACLIGKGNCTDFHSLFISLARAMGIPAKFVMGFLLPENNEGELSGYHCWAEFYIEGTGWYPVDISAAWKNQSKKDYYFGNCCENRVEFSEGRDIVLEPKQKNKLLNYFIYPYCEIDGNIHHQIENRFKFRNL